MKIKLVINVLEVDYEGRLLSFKKVSSNYSIDVFGEFIKSLIFEPHSTYTLDSFVESNNFKKKKFDRNNFQQALKEIFRSDVVEVAQLGVFKHMEFCLPEIAIYYSDKESKWTSPRLLGIITDKGIVKFIDATGSIILTLKPN